VNFDISWDEVGEVCGRISSSRIARVAAMLIQVPDRFLFGSDTVAPASPAAYYAVFDMWAPVFSQLTARASFKVRKGQLRADLRRRSPTCSRVGAGEREDDRA
jgi:hypothetical protein